MERERGRGFVYVRESIQGVSKLLNAFLAKIYNEFSLVKINRTEFFFLKFWLLHLKLR